ncbi:MAG: hypothetical protein AAGJ40_04460 [Planctomycetota bacterium]
MSVWKSRRTLRPRVRVPSRWRSLALSVALFGIIAEHAAAEDSLPRQHYSEFKTHAGRGYSLATYFYKPYPDYRGYKYHYVVCPSDHPEHLYLYNPIARTYYGRMLVVGTRVTGYQSLPPSARSSTLEEIADGEFQTQTFLPGIPEAADREAMMPPPPEAIEALQPF